MKNLSFCENSKKIFFFFFFWGGGPGSGWGVRMDVNEKFKFL